MNPIIGVDMSAVRVAVYAHGGSRRPFDWTFARKAACLLAVLLIAMAWGDRSYAQTTSSGLEYVIFAFGGPNCTATASSASEAVAQLQACYGPWNNCNAWTFSVIQQSMGDTRDRE
jgi:hypothetical protein